MRLVLVKLIIAALCCIVAPAFGQVWPERPVRITLPFPPGGGTDYLARLLAEKLTASLGQSVIVENRVGAGGTIGSNFVAKAPPDGYTLLVNAGSIAIVATMYPKLPYDTVKDFAPISMIATQPHVVVVHSSVPAKSVSELIDWIKSNPGKANYGSAGHGTGTHLATELFIYQAKVNMQHVPFKGAGPAVLAAVAGDVPIMIATVSAVLPQVQAGKLKLLAITTPRRLPMYNLPTVSESGVPGYEYTTWYAMFTTAGVPRPIIDKLNSHLSKILASADVKDTVEKQGLEAGTSTPEELGTLLKREIDVWGNVVRAANLKPE